MPQTASAPGTELRPWGTDLLTARIVLLYFAALGFVLGLTTARRGLRIVRRLPPRLLFLPVLLLPDPPRPSSQNRGGSPSMGFFISRSFPCRLSYSYFAPAFPASRSSFNLRFLAVVKSTSHTYFTAPPFVFVGKYLSIQSRWVAPPYMSTVPG